jgi:hypothetical protein
MTKAHISQVISAFLIGILTSGVIVKFERQIENLTSRQSVVIGVSLLCLAVIALLGPTLLLRIPSIRKLDRQSPTILTIYLLLILFAMLCVAGLLFLATSKLPTRENLPFYVANVGPFVGLAGVCAHVLFNFARHLAYDKEPSILDSSLCLNLFYFLSSLVLVYGFSDATKMSPRIIVFSLGFGGASFGMAAGTFKGYLWSSSQFVGEMAREMRKRDDQISQLSRGKIQGRKRKKSKIR